MSCGTQSRPGNERTALPCTALAGEVFKTTRASLSELARPITPADTNRRLLQSDGYLHRPQTAGRQQCSNDFNQATGAKRVVSSHRSAAIAPAGNQALQWPTSGNLHCSQVAAEVWSAEDAQPAAASLTQGDTPSCNSVSCSSQCRPQSAASRGLGLHTRRGINPLHAAGLLGVAAHSRSSTATTHKGSTVPALATTGEQVEADVAAVSPDELLHPAGRVDMPDTASQGAQPAHSNSMLHTSFSSSSAQHLPSTAATLTSADACGDGRSSTNVDTTASRCVSSRGSTTGSRPQLAAAAGPNSTDKDAVQIQAWQHSVLRVLQQMRSLPLGAAAAAAGGAAGLVQCCAALQSLLDEAEDLGHLQLCLAMYSEQTAEGRAPGGRAAAGSGPVGASSVREMLLTELVRLVDCPKADVLIKVGSMMLRLLPLHDNRMLPLAKMLYRLSKDSSNDARFRHHGAIRPLLAVVADHSAWLEGMNSQQQQQQEQEQEQQTREQLRALLKQQQEVLLLLTGSLKNISLDNTNQGSLGRLHAVAAMGQVLAAQVQLITSAGAGSCSSFTAFEGASRGVLHAAEVQCAQQQQPEQQAGQRLKQAEAALQISIQVTAVLRNLAVQSSNTHAFAQQDGVVLGMLLKLAAVCAREAELLLMISRCFSKLSLQQSCRTSMLRMSTAELCARTFSTVDFVCARPASSCGRQGPDTGQSRTSVRTSSNSVLCRASSQGRKVSSIACDEAPLADIDAAEADRYQAQHHRNCDDGNIKQLTHWPQQQLQWSQDGRQGNSHGQEREQSQLAVMDLMLQWLLQPHQLAADAKSRSFLVRVAFTVCNLTTHHPEARQALAAVPGALQGLLNLLQELLRLSQQERQAVHQDQQQLELERHMEQQQQRLQANQDAAPSTGPTGPVLAQLAHCPVQPCQPDAIADIGTRPVRQAAAVSAAVPVEELLVKVVRLIANAAVDQQVAGPMLCASPHMLACFVQLLQTFSFAEHEELVLNSVAAVSNLAFYNTSCNQLRQLREPGLLLKPLLALLTSGSEEAVTEAARAIANLVRGPTPAGLQLLCMCNPCTCTAAQAQAMTDASCSSCADKHHHATTVEPGMAASAVAAMTAGDSQCSAKVHVGPVVLEALVLLLNHSSWGVVCGVAGALLNLSAAETSAAAFGKAGAALALHEVLARVLAELPGELDAECTADHSTMFDQKLWHKQQQGQPVEHSCAGQIIEAAQLGLQCIANLAGGAKAKQQQQLSHFPSHNESKMLSNLLVTLAGQLKSLESRSHRMTDLSALVVVVGGIFGSRFD